MSGKQVTLQDGTVVTAKRGVVVAVEGPEAKRILGDALEVGGRMRGVAGRVAGRVSQ